MALLELKKDANLIESDTSTVYLLDEPDTHLHVRAQMQLLDTLSQFSKDNHQIIIATHSPFLINAVSPNKIRLLTSSAQNCTKVRSLHSEVYATERALHAMGIENIFLFFARTIVLVRERQKSDFYTPITAEKPTRR